MDNNNELLFEALLNRIASIMGEKEGNNKNKSSFLSFYRPGIPFQPESLQFVGKGMTSAETTTDEDNKIVNDWMSFSTEVNRLPTDNDPVYTPSENNLVKIYENVLRFSKVPKDEITEEQKEKIVRLVKKVEKMTEAYDDGKAKYDIAVATYNQKRIEALVGTSKQASLDFSLNGKRYSSDMQKAMDSWVSKGYKNEYEKAVADINMLSRRSMNLVKRDLLSRFEKHKMMDVLTETDFYPVILYPSNFVNSDKGWTELTFTAKDIAHYQKESQSSTSGSVGLRWKLFSLKASGGYEKAEKHIAFDQNDFSVKFKITQATISRPWFSSDFVTNNLWKWGITNPGELSDGGDPPKGSMVGFPTTAVFVKDIEISSSDIKQRFDEIQKTITAGGSVGWGPFRIGANHKSSSKETNLKFNTSAGTLNVEGMQLIGYRCYQMPKTPNCQIKDEDLV